jgi:hypothetical protein
MKDKIIAFVEISAAVILISFLAFSVISQKMIENHKKVIISGMVDSKIEVNIDNQENFKVDHINIKVPINELDDAVIITIYLKDQVGSKEYSFNSNLGFDLSGDFSEDNTKYSSLIFFIHKDKAVNLNRISVPLLLYIYKNDAEEKMVGEVKIYL